MQKGKLTINVRDGTLAIEGEESLVREVYQDFRDFLQAGSLPRGSGKAEGAYGGSKAAGRVQETYTSVPSLELSSKGGKQDLQDFFAQKQPVTAFEHNVVFVYYLQKIQNMSAITLDHIYTCYKYAGAKLPSAFRQSVVDTSHKKHFLDTRSLKDIRVATKGENYVDYQLPKSSHSIV
ncbi:MAG TPA: hypothetical protein VGA53_03005 [Candidatus Paceibacterota bacterium]